MPQSTTPNRGRFKPGPDPRRHAFTTEERQRGFWSAIESIVTRYPHAVNARGHIVLNFLPVVISRKSARRY